jgi:hypothetical protein
MGNEINREEGDEEIIEEGDEENKNWKIRRRNGMRRIKRQEREDENK